MKERGEVNGAAVWHFQFVWAVTLPSPPWHTHTHTRLHLLTWPRAVWLRSVRSLLLAAEVFVCGRCLLLMLLDILAGVLSVWLPRCCGCSDIFKGSSIWAAVSVYVFLSPSSCLLLSRLPLFNHSDQDKDSGRLIVKYCHCKFTAFTFVSH